MLDATKVVGLIGLARVMCGVTWAIVVYSMGVVRPLGSVGLSSATVGLSLASVGFSSATVGRLLAVEGLKRICPKDLLV